MTEIKFGTEGWRAIIAQDFTFDNVRACAQGIADYLGDQGGPARGLVVGYDTRFASEHFAAAVAEVAAANRIPVFLCQRPTPTPVICYEVTRRGAAGGVVITASHNPAQWNGLKFKPDYGGSASPEVVTELERRIARVLEKGDVPSLPLSQALEQGVVQPIDPYPAYARHLERLVDLGELRQAGLKVVADAMYGAGAGYLAKLLAGGTTRVVELHGERNPLFPGLQPEPIAHNLKGLMQAVKRRKAQVGLATDGDADRLGVVDERGNYVTPLQVLALLALYFLEGRGERGALVKTVTASSMVFRLGEVFQVPVYETPVGFKYVGPLMIKEKALLGGEESGGYGFRGHVPERDGILAGLYFLSLMVRLGKSPTELVAYLYSRVGPHFYDRWDLTFPASQRAAIVQRLAQAQPADIGGIPLARRDSTDGFRFHLADGSWLLVRFSGTEPVLRIYAEAPSPQQVTRLLEAGRALVEV